MPKRLGPAALPGWLGGEGEGKFSIHVTLSVTSFFKESDTIRESPDLHPLPSLPNASTWLIYSFLVRDEDA